MMGTENTFYCINNRSVMGLTLWSSWRPIFIQQKLKTFYKVNNRVNSISYILFLFGNPVRSS